MAAPDPSVLLQEVLRDRRALEQELDEEERARSAQDADLRRLGDDTARLREDVRSAKERLAAERHES